MMKSNQVTAKEMSVWLRVVLAAPPVGVDFGIQEGKGNDYKTILKQRSNVSALTFEFMMTVKNNKADGKPNFVGPIAQGPSTARFVYIDIGRLAGQAGSVWERRIKVPLEGITSEMIQKAISDPKLLIETQLPGTGKDGGPSCATVVPKQGWKCCKRVK
jgi:hypothetical protein